jgi:ATP-dependent Clp protease protease subunit
MSTLIPMVVEKDGRGERSYDIFSRLLKDNIIMINGPINDQVSSVVTAQLLFCQSVDPKKQINIYINSGGGVITSGLAIINTMEMVDNPVSVVCVGQACSMAAVILACGDKGKRFCLPDSRVMIHQPSGGTEGVHADMEISISECKRLRDLIYCKLAKRMGKTVKQVEKMCDRDFWMSSSGAVDKGIADKVLG